MAPPEHLFAKAEWDAVFGPIGGHFEKMDEDKDLPHMHRVLGSEAGDVPALLATLQRVADFVMEKRESLVEFEINPLLVRPKGKGVCAVDAVLQYARAS